MFTKLKVPKDIYFINFGGCDHNISTLYIDIYILHIQCTDTILLCLDENKELCCFDCKVFAASANTHSVPGYHYLTFWEATVL